MNLNQLWSGEDYVYFSNRGRGEVYRPYGVRVRIRKVYRQKIPGNERLSGFARVDYLNDDGSPRLDSYNSEPITDREVRARDIAMRWDEYIDERDHREAEKMRLVREQEERARKEEEAKTNLTDMMLIKMGIPREAVNSIGSNHVSLNRTILERTLGIAHE